MNNLIKHKWLASAFCSHSSLLIRLRTAGHLINDAEVDQMQINYDILLQWLVSKLIVKITKAIHIIIGLFNIMQFEIKFEVDLYNYIISHCYINEIKSLFYTCLYNRFRSYSLSISKSTIVGQFDSTFFITNVIINSGFNISKQVLLYIYPTNGISQTGTTQKKQYIV